MFRIKPVILNRNRFLLIQKKWSTIDTYKKEICPKLKERHVHDENFAKETKKNDRMNPKLLDFMKKIGKTEEDLWGRKMSVQDMDLYNLTKIPTELPGKDILRKNGFDVDDDIVEKCVKNNDYFPLAKIFPFAYKEFSPKLYGRFLAFVTKTAPFLTPDVDPGHKPFDPKFDNDRILEIKVKLEAGKKYKIRPYFEGNYMNNLAKKWVRKLKYSKEDIKFFGLE